MPFFSRQFFFVCVCVCVCGLSTILMCHEASMLGTNVIVVLDGGRRTLDIGQFNASGKG